MPWRSSVVFGFDSDGTLDETIALEDESDFYESFYDS